MLTIGRWFYLALVVLAVLTAPYNVNQAVKGREPRSIQEAVAVQIFGVLLSFFVLWMVWN